MLGAAVVLPAASVALAVKLWRPWPSAAVVNVHPPLPSASTAPSLHDALPIFTVLLASAVPASVGLVSLVKPPLATVPVTGAASSLTEVMVGAAGAPVSMLTL